MRLVFIGPPGSGKGTQAKLLQERLGVQPIGTGDILRAALKDGTPTGKIAEPYMKRGELVPDTVINDVVAEYFHGPNPPQKFAMDGYPRTLAQAEAFAASLRQCRLDLTRVLVFNVPDDEVVHRLSGRKSAETRLDDDIETIRNRLKVYNQTAQPLIDYYRRAGLLREIIATGDVEEIYGRVLDQVGP